MSHFNYYVMSGLARSHFNCYAMSGMSHFNYNVMSGLARSHFNCNAMSGLRSICLLKLFLFPTVFTLQLQCDERAKLNTSASLSQIHHRSARCVLALIKREVMAGSACFMPILALDNRFTLQLPCDEWDKL